ncbi:hypothetical protein CLOP_g20939, partial [Closterium sp. NIES-67]
KHFLHILHMCSDSNNSWLVGMCSMSCTIQAHLHKHKMNMQRHANPTNHTNNVAHKTHATK